MRAKNVKLTFDILSFIFSTRRTGSYTATLVGVYIIIRVQPRAFKCVFFDGGIGTRAGTTRTAIRNSRTHRVLHYYILFYIM